MKSDKKVIILDNIDSDCIEQAMFILKDERPKHIDAVAEAEQIVENYVKRYHYSLYAKSHRKRKIPLQAVVICASSLFMVALGVVLAIVL